MKKLLSMILVLVMFVSTSFASSMTITRKNKNRIENYVQKVIKKVERKTSSEAKRKQLYLTITDTIFWYIALNSKKITDSQQTTLLYFNTLLLKHMWYRIANEVELIVID